MATNVFDLSAKISLDSSQYEKGLEQSKSLFTKFGDGIKSAANTAGKVVADIAKGATAAIGAAGTALTALTKQSLDIYANFEQLEGGTKLMFGEAADYIIQKSEEAYKTVQLSQNEYLQQVNGFAVGLKTALGGNAQAAAELADKIVQAEADIVAATGNTQEMVQNAFNGIMRNNYMMLDNLGLGIKPTKEGMEEVIQKVNEWNEAHGKATSYVIDNLADVQSALVDYIEMQGMAGYASMEAGSTITGSIAGVKAAWQNFLSGNGSVKDFTDMLIPTVKNIRSKLDTIIPRLTEGLTELVDQVSPYIPELIEETLPSIIEGASTLLTGLAERLPELITAILPALADGVVSVTTALVGVMPELITSLKESIPLVVQTIMSKKDDLLNAGKDIISAIVPTDTATLTNVASKATEIIGKLLITLTNPENAKKVMDKGFDIIDALADGLTSQESLNNFLDEENGAPKIIENLGEALVHFVDRLLTSAGDIISNVCGYFVNPDNKEKIKGASEKILINLGEGFTKSVKSIYKDIVDTMAKISAQMVTDFDADTTAAGMMGKLAKAIYNYALHDSLLGWVIGTAELNYFQETESRMEAEQAFNDSSFPGYLDEWMKMGPDERNAYMSGTTNRAGSSYDEDLKVAQLRASGVPQAGIDAYLRSQGYASGFYADRPTFISNALVGENGDEVLLPLDNNTDWMDKFADKLGSRIGGGGVVFEAGSIVIQANGNGPDIADRFIEAVDEKLASLQAREYRGIGMAWGGLGT